MLAFLLVQTDNFRPNNLLTCACEFICMFLIFFNDYKSFTDPVSSKDIRFHLWDVINTNRFTFRT